MRKKSNKSPNYSAGSKNTNQYTMKVEHSFEQLLSDNKEEVIYVVVNEDDTEGDPAASNDTVVRITKKYCEILKNGWITSTMYYEDL